MARKPLRERFLEALTAIEVEEISKLHNLVSELHDRIMNLPEDMSALSKDEKIRRGFQEGHKQARHQAAEMALQTFFKYLEIEINS